MPHFWQTTNARMHRIVFLVSTDVLAYPETRQDCIDVEVGRLLLCDCFYYFFFVFFDTW